MKASRLFLTLLAGTALVMVAKAIRNRRDAPRDGYFYDALPFTDLSEDEDLRHLYPDNPVHSQDDTDHPMFV